MSNVTALKEAQEQLFENTFAQDPTGQLDPEPQSLVDNPEDFPREDESILEDTLEQVWEPTHYIGNTPVQEKTFVNGLRYWINEEGKRRRPTKLTPLRRYVKMESPRNMTLDRDAFALACAALKSADGRAEEGWTVAEKVNEGHVRLTLRLDGEHIRYMIQIPDWIEIVGTKLP